MLFLFGLMVDVKFLYVSAVEVALRVAVEYVHVLVLPFLPVRVADVVVDAVHAGDLEVDQHLARRLVQRHLVEGLDDVQADVRAEVLVL